MPVERWMKVEDDKIRQIWTCDCGDPDCPGAQKGGLIIGPDGYTDMGVPICANSGDDMEYNRTEAKLTMETLWTI